MERTKERAMRKGNVGNEVSKGREEKVIRERTK
jgi:hypothetical protein